VSGTGKADVCAERWRADRKVSAGVAKNPATSSRRVTLM
jgi:hypothetical protein